MSDQRPVLTGGCQCGAVRYAIHAEAVQGSICHCRMCQKASGNYFAAFAEVKQADMQWTKGEAGWFRSSEAAERGFCRECGTPLSFRYIGSEWMGLTVGSLDTPDRVEMTAQCGIESRRPAFETLPSLKPIASNEDASAEERAKRASRQHPDHD